MSLRERIDAQARRLGFDAVGIAPAVAPASAPHLLSWLEQGHHGSMEWMAREPQRRADPRVYWPPARSLVVCARSYAPAHEPAPDPSGLRGQVAAYARGEDYHDVLKADLRALGAWLEGELPGLSWRPVVDSSAVLERAHAVAAGLGWTGKNTMLLSRTLGSYTLLGALLVDQELPPDAPTTAHCGSCRACLDACPTGALLEPYLLDSRRCISYLTIELRGDVPFQHRAAMGDWLFGCDVCQQVCPWVRKAGGRVTSGPFAPVGDRARPDLGRVLGLSPEGFSEWARKSPMKRTKRVGLQRNAAVCLGNADDAEGATGLLIPALDHEEPLVRRHVAWALMRHNLPAGREAVAARLTLEADPPTRDAIERVLDGEDR